MNREFRRTIAAAILIFVGAILMVGMLVFAPEIFFIVVIPVAAGCAIGWAIAELTE